MSGLLLKNRCFMRTLRKSFLSLSPLNSTVRVTNPRLHIIARHQRNFASLAIKQTENGNYTENSESTSHQGSAPANVDAVIFDLDSAAKRNGRIPYFLVEKALSLATNSGEALTSVQSLYLLRSCGLMLRETPETKVKVADEVWKELEKLGCVFDVRHYNSVLKIYVDCDHQFKPSDFLVRLESNNVEPNRVTFLYLMEKYCNDGDLNGASEILEYMKEKGFPVNENVFSALITGHMRINDISGAMEIFDVMRSSNLNPGSQSYLALARGHAWNGNIKGVKSTIQEAEKSGIQISKEDHLSILSSIISDDHLSYVDEVISEMGNVIFSCKQSILNTVFGLINKGACESAFHLILCISTDEDSSRLNTNIFLNHIAKTNQPIENILKFVKEIYEKNLNNLAYLNCAKSCIDAGQFDKGFKVFEEMIKMGFPVRSFHVLPVFENLKSEQEVFSTLKKMFDLGLPADFEIFSDGVLPNINCTDPEGVLRKIEETGQSRTSAYDALFTYYCHTGQSSNALYLAKKYPVDVSSDFKVKAFLSSHAEAEKRDEFSPFHEVLSFALQTAGKKLRLPSEMEGKLLADLISLDPSAFSIFAKRSKEENFKFQKRSLEVCRSILFKINPALSNYVNKLEDSSDKNAINMTIDYDRELQRLKNRGQNTEMYMQQLLQQYIRNKNFDKVNELKTELENNNVMLSPKTLVSLFRCYKEQCNIEEAGKFLKTLNENYPDFEVDTAQIIEFASLLVKFSKFDDALDAIKSNCRVLRINGSRDFLYRITRKFFDCTIESGNIDFLRKAQSQLMTVFTGPNHAKIMTEPFVKMHLFRDNLEDAVKEFKSLVNDKKVAPYTIQLMKKCIMSEDHQTLETVIETASSLEGKIPILQELAIAFFELGRIDQAAQVIENLGRKVQPSFVRNTCLNIYSDKSIKKFEEFLSIFKNVEGLNLSKEYSYLFKLYDAENDAQRALNMYKKMKHISLDDTTKELLTNLLRVHNVDVPSELQETTTVKEDGEVTGQSTDPVIEEFLKALREGDVASALEKLGSMKKGDIRSLSLSDLTKVVELTIEHKLGQDFSRNVLAMSYLIENAVEVLRPVLSKYSEAGDVESIHHVSNFLPDFTLKGIAFNSFLCRAYLNSGKHSELLAEMESRFNVKNKVYSSVAFLEILNHPDLVERALNLAEQYYETKFYPPMTMVWAHYLLNENYDAADKVEQAYKIEGDTADSILLRSVRRSENITLGRKYINNLNKYNSRMRQKERAYGTLLDVLVLKEKHDEAVALVEESKRKGIVLDKHFRSTLVTLKSALERENKPVPFTIQSEETIITA